MTGVLSIGVSRSVVHYGYDQKVYHTSLAVYVEEVLQLSDFQHEVFRHDIEDLSHPEKLDKSLPFHSSRLEQKPTFESDRQQSPMTYYIPTLHTNGKGNSSMAKLHAHSHKSIGMTGSKAGDERKVKTILRLSTSLGL